MIGTFVARDMLLFYVFWETMLIPMYFIIGIWGGERRIYAAVKFFIFTMVGSLLMLVAILYLYFNRAGDHGPRRTWLQLDALGRATQMLALRRPSPWPSPSRCRSVPLHTWLPDAHVEAPTAGSVILAGVLLKMGTYGFLRFALPLFPDAAIAAAPVDRRRWP